METFTYIIFINGTAEKIWEAITTPECTRQYWNNFSIRSDWEVGSAVELVKPDGSLNWKGKVVRCEANSLLVHTFDPSVDPNYAGEKPSAVTWMIGAHLGATMLTLAHAGMSEEFYGGARIGWAYFLSSIKSLVETGKALEWKCD